MRSCINPDMLRHKLGPSCLFLQHHNHHLIFHIQITKLTYFVVREERWRNHSLMIKHPS